MPYKYSTAAQTRKQLLLLEREDKNSGSPVKSSIGTVKATAGASTGAFINNTQRKEAALVDRLPSAFPIDQWESMPTKAQLNAMKFSGLNEQEQWTLLNASTPLGTLATMNNIQSGLAAKTVSATVAASLGNALNKITADQKRLNTGDASNLPSLQKSLLRGELGKTLEELKARAEGMAAPAEQLITPPMRTLPHLRLAVGDHPSPNQTPDPALEEDTKSGNILADRWNALKSWVAGLFSPKEAENEPSPAPQIVPITTVPPSATPIITPIPMPSPTPMPTPKPTANVDMIGQIVNEGRNNGDPFFLRYSQQVGNRYDCSTQVFSFYSVKGLKNPLNEAEHQTCESYYKTYNNPQNSIEKNGGVVQSTVQRDVAKGVDPVPADWQSKAEFGDMVIWMKDPEYDKAGRLITKREDAAWHIGLCTGNGQMIDRAQREENNPSGKEEGLFVRGLDTIPSTYKLIMIIKPGDESRLTPDEIYEYLLNPPK